MSLPLTECCCAGPEFALSLQALPGAPALLPRVRPGARSVAPLVRLERGGWQGGAQVIPVHVRFRRVGAAKPVTSFMQKSAVAEGSLPEQVNVRVGASDEAYPTVETLASRSRQGTAAAGATGGGGESLGNRSPAPCRTHFLERGQSTMK